MSEQDRRTFLKRAAGAAAAAGGLPLVGCEAEPEDEPVGGQDRTGLSRPLLDAVAAEVLPSSDLGRDGLDRAVDGFLHWLDGYEPVAELDHAYLTDELRYAPADPGPRWRADLEALELEARQRHEQGFVDLDTDSRRSILEAALADEGDSMPSPARARHVALGLMAWFFASSEANDLCYQARVGRHECRGIDSLPQEPQPLEAGP